MSEGGYIYRESPGDLLRLLTAEWGYQVIRSTTGKGIRTSPAITDEHLHELREEYGIELECYYRTREVPMKRRVINPGFLEELGREGGAARVIAKLTLKRLRSRRE
jgi:hypothetical protein